MQAAGASNLHHRININTSLAEPLLTKGFLVLGLATICKNRARDHTSTSSDGKR
jgi:hypothetical protein